MTGKLRPALIGAVVATAVVVAGVVLAVKYGQEPHPAARDEPRCPPRGLPRESAEPPPPQGAADGWRLAYQHDRTDQSELLSMDGTGMDNLWAVGQATGAKSCPLIVRHDSSGWREIPVPASYELTWLDGVAVAATPAGAWVVLSRGPNDDPEGEQPQRKSVLLHWTSAGWEQHESPGSGVDVDAVADDDVWHAFVSDRDEAAVRHWDGRSWTRTPLPGDPIRVRVTARAHNDVWLSGSKGSDHRPYLAHWSGKGWREVTPPAVAAPSKGQVNLWDVVSASATEQWALIAVRPRASGPETFPYRRVSGHGWREVATPAIGRDDLIFRITVDGHGTVWLATGQNNVVFRRVNGGWEKSKIPRPGASFSYSLNDITAVGGTACVAGEVIHPGDGDVYDATVYCADQP